MKKLLLMLSLCTACTLGYAQDSNNELLNKLVEKNILTQSEADSLRSTSPKEEEKNTIAQTTDKVRQAFNTPYMRFGGYGMFLYRYSDLAKVKHSTEPKLIIISMRGELTPNFKYFALMDFINPTLYELWGEWSPAKEFNLRFGEMKTPLALESQISLTEIEGVSNTRSISALIGMGDDVQRLQNGKNNTGRDIGILAHGNLFKVKNYDLLQYNVGVFQGTGINTRENNNTKDLAVNAMLQPIKDFRIGGGAYFGEAVYKKVGEATEASHVRNRWIVSSDYKTDRFYARAEWIKGNDGGIQKEGLHGVGLYYFMPDKLNTFAKIDYLNINKKFDSEVIDYVLGVNYYFYKGCRFQLNYTYSDYSKGWGERNSNIVTGQMQIVF